jgi:hypothetical protein
MAYDVLQEEMVDWHGKAWPALKYWAPPYLQLLFQEPWRTLHKLLDRKPFLPPKHRYMVSAFLVKFVFALPEKLQGSSPTARILNSENFLWSPVCLFLHGLFVLIYARKDSLVWKLTQIGCKHYHAITVCHPLWVVWYFDLMSSSNTWVLL